MTHPHQAHLISTTRDALSDCLIDYLHATEHTCDQSAMQSIGQEGRHASGLGISSVG